MTTLALSWHSNAEIVMKTFAGIDIETTGSSLAAGHRICQIGVALGALDSVCVDVNATGAPYEEEALRVNGFTPERLTQGVAPLEVDLQVGLWLEQRAVKPRSLIPVGWNVAGFDMPFIRAQLPGVGGFCHYRTVDLNAICFALDGKGGHSWEWWKKQAKTEAAAMLGRAEWHDAGFDAVAALVAFFWLRIQVRG